MFSIEIVEMVSFELGEELIDILIDILIDVLIDVDYRH